MALQVKRELVNVTTDTGSGSLLTNELKSSGQFNGLQAANLQTVSPLATTPAGPPVGPKPPARKSSPQHAV